MKAIFLDIHGVINSPDSKNRKGEYDILTLCNKLNQEVNNQFDYLEYICGSSTKIDSIKVNDIEIPYYDWDKQAISWLKDVIEKTDAKIILYGSHKTHGYWCSKAFLDIQGLGKYLYDSTFYTPERSINNKMYTIEQIDEMIKDKVSLFKQLESCIANDLKEKGISNDMHINEEVIGIQEYLDRHQEITSYAVVGDSWLENGLTNHYVHTVNLLTQDDANKMLKILENEDGPYTLPDSIPHKNLESWRKKSVINGKHMFMNDPHYKSLV